MSDLSPQLSASFIRATHPHGFRSGQWAQLVAVDSESDPERPCYLVVFPDGATDRWLVDDPSDPYEFAEAVPA